MPSRKKKYLQAIPLDNTDNVISLIRHNNGLIVARTDNSAYPKGGVSCYRDSFVVNQTLVFHIMFCGKSPALLVATKHYGVRFINKDGSANVQKIVIHFLNRISWYQKVVFHKLCKVKKLF